MIEIAAVSLAAALEDDRLAGHDPLRDIAWLHRKKIVDGGVEDVTIGGEDFCFIFVEFLEVTFQLFQAFGFLFLAVGAVAFAIAKGPQGMAIDEHWVDNFAIPFGRVKFDRGLGPEAIVVLEV